ncbi:MAG: hypothetical protein Q9172_001573 [Xanthocarpia lactea]
MSKVLTVFGATGLQGGSLLHYLLKRPDVLNIYRLRGITRDLSKPAAIALKEAGVEMLQGDMDNEASLSAALAGSTAVFSMTNFWEKASAESEVAQGKAIANAAVGAGAELIVWSSLPNMTAMSNDDDPHVQAEAGELVFRLTWSKPCPMIEIADTGKFIVPILLNPNKYNGKRFIGATAFYSPAELVETWKKVTGKEIKLGQASDEAWGQNIPPEIMEVLKDSSGLIEDYRYYGPSGQEDLEWTLAQMDDPPTTWAKFVEANEPWF